MEQTHIQTTLLPPEIATARKVRAKKPWAVLAAALLLLAMSISAYGFAGRNKTVSVEKFGIVEGEVDRLNKKVAGYEGNFNGLVKKFNEAEVKEKNLLSPLKNRNKWGEWLKTLNECLPRDVGNNKDVTKLSEKKMIKISSITTERVPDVGEWFRGLKDGEKFYMLLSERKTDAPVPKGEGYIVTLKGSHFHDDPDNIEESTALFVQKYLIKSLQKWTLLRNSPGSKQVDIRKMGISHATIIAATPKPYRHYKNGRRQSPLLNNAKNSGIESDLGKEEFEDITQTVFKVQFIWKPISVKDRDDISPEQKEAIEKSKKG